MGRGVALITDNLRMQIKLIRKIGMNEKDNGISSSRGEILFYETQDGKVRVECRF